MKDDFHQKRTRKMIAPVRLERGKLLAQIRKLGADLAGVASAQSLIEEGAILHEPLENARSAVVVAVRQSFAALRSPVISMAQHDTLYAYSKAHDITHALVRMIEDAGAGAVAIPAFLPIDMSDEIKGMRGEVDHRRTAATAGLGQYGLNNLLITEKYGPRVRFATVITTALIEPSRPRKRKLCTECGACTEACPAGALSVPGTTDKRACGRKVFDYGLRGLMKFGFEWIDSNKKHKAELLQSGRLRELWQNFMTGMYYTCFACQAACPVGEEGAKKKQTKGKSYVH